MTMLKRLLLAVVVAAVTKHSTLSADSATETHAKCNIVVSGSSTVWGQGLLDDGFVGPIDDYIKKTLSTTILPPQMKFSKNNKPLTPVIYKNPKQYQGIGSTTSDVGATVEFELSGDELAICQTIQRTASWAKLGVYANGKRIATFTNKNPTLGKSQVSFTGDGKTKLFELERPFTYNHNVSIDGNTQIGTHNTKGYMSAPPFRVYPQYDYLVVRKNNIKRHPVHALLFKTAPADGAIIKVAYDYGTVVAHTKCTIGETNDGNAIESRYGLGRIHHDPANPTYLSTGLDFRYINREAFFIHRFSKNATRKIKLVIEGGVNPYFTINFATNRYHNLMNAGIGGFRADSFLRDKFGRSYREAVTPFLPDIYFIALGGNDDWKESSRLVSRKITDVDKAELKQLPVLELHAVKKQGNGQFTVTKNTGLIDSITPTTLSSKQLVDSKVQAGNFIRIGNYSGDNRSVAVRVISDVDTKTGRIQWNRPLSAAELLCIEKLDDLIGAEIAVRSLDKYTRNMDELIRSLKAANPTMQIILLNVYNTNFFTRQIWGYSETQRNLAGRYPNVHTLNAATALQDFQMTHISGKNAIELTATGAREYILPWKGHWQGFRVWVDGKDVYGRDCIIQSGMYYGVPKDKTGNIKDFERDYCRSRNSKVITHMKLIFLRNPPKTGTVLRVERADTLWSGDFAHPGKAGIHVIGRECISKLRSLTGN